MNEPKLAAIVEARMTSSRLPGKVLMHAGGRPMLSILLERLRRSITLKEIIVATTTNETDDPIVELCRLEKVKVHRGSEHNVLDRVCGASSFNEVDIIAEVTGDNVLIDPILLDGLVNRFLTMAPQTRYLTGDVGGDFTSAKIFYARDLYEINDGPNDANDREHVSFRFYQPEFQEKYHPFLVQYEGELHRPELMVVLDYKEDYELIRAVYEDLYPKNPEFSALDIIHWLDAHPQIRDRAIAAHQ